MFTLSPKFVLLLMLATLALFLCPAASGSFPATHGPTTALRAAARWNAVLAAIAGWTALLAGRVTVSRSVVHDSKAQAIAASYTASQLRC